METLQSQFNDANAEQWLARFAVASDFALAVVCGACLCVIAYFAMARRDVDLPVVLWLLAVYLAASAIQHLVQLVFDQSPTGWPGLVQVFVALLMWMLFVVTLKWLPTWSHFGVLAKKNQDLQREVEHLRVEEAGWQQRVTELERINAELEYVSRGVVGREERILELKREINHLLQRVGEPPRYRAAMDLPV